MGQIAKGGARRRGQDGERGARPPSKSALAARKEELAASELAAAIDAAAVDVTLPGRSQQVGTRHPHQPHHRRDLQRSSSAWATVGHGPREVETDYYNFGRWNAPGRPLAAAWPTRSMCATFPARRRTVRGGPTYCCAPDLRRAGARDGGQRAAIYVIAPGKVCTAATWPTRSHLPQFRRSRGLVVDGGITFGDLKGTLDYLCKQMFGEERKTRFRAHYFPFTEPSAEVDVSCGICHGEGCPASARGTGWLEILGCGMGGSERAVHVGHRP